MYLIMNPRIVFALSHKLLPAFFLVMIFSRCGQDQQASADATIKQMDTALVVKIAQAIDSTVKPVLAPGLSLSLWGIDSLVISPIGISIDNLGNLFYTTTERQQNTEFDIRGHRDWEIA